MHNNIYYVYSLSCSNKIARKTKPILSCLHLLSCDKPTRTYPHERITVCTIYFSGNLVILIVFVIPGLINLSHRIGRVSIIVVSRSLFIQFLALSISFHFTCTLPPSMHDVEFTSAAKSVSLHYSADCAGEGSNVKWRECITAII